MDEEEANVNEAEQARIRMNGLIAAAQRDDGWMDDDSFHFSADEEADFFPAKEVNGITTIINELSISSSQPPPPRSQQPPVIVVSPRVEDCDDESPCELPDLDDYS